MGVMCVGYGLPQLEGSIQNLPRQPLTNTKMFARGALFMKVIQTSDPWLFPGIFPLFTFVVLLPVHFISRYDAAFEQNTCPATHHKSTMPFPADPQPSSHHDRSEVVIWKVLPPTDGSRNGERKRGN